MVRAVVAAVLVVLLCAVAFADGGMFSRRFGAPDPANTVTPTARTPDQRALLAYDEEKGVETLVIETTVQGEGREFAWILPLPAAPKIEASTTGLFPTLETLTGADVTTHFAPWPGVILGCGIALATHIRTRKHPGVDPLAVFLVVAALAGFAWLDETVGGLGRDLTMAGSITYGDGDTLTLGKGDPGPPPTTVRILSRETIGALDSVVLTATDAGDVRRWLDENGYAVPAAVDPVIAGYVRDGWVFVATKIRADASSDDVRNLLPLAFTFPAKQPVYPMRLTGALNETLDLDLYVFADRRAVAGDIRAVHARDFLAGSGPLGIDGLTTHPEILRRAGSAASLTVLSGRIEGDAMHRDVDITWAPRTEIRTLVVTAPVARMRAATAGSIVAALGLCIGASWIRGRERRELRTSPTTRTFAVVAAVAAAASAVTAFAWSAQDRLPDGAALVVSRWQHGAQFDSLPGIEWGGPLQGSAPRITIDEARAAVAAALLEERLRPTDAVPIERDSPWNYTLTDEGGRIAFRWYADDGSPSLPRFIERIGVPPATERRAR